MSETRDVFRLLDDIPPLPNLAQWILNLSYNDTNIADLSVAIEINPPLTARILRLANSAYFGRQSARIRTIYDAIYKVLGLKLVKHLTLGILLSGIFRPERCGSFNLDRFWFTSIGTGILAQKLLPALPSALRSNVENIYLNGLLHNIGMLALAHHFPDEMDRILSRPDTGKPLGERTRGTLGIDHHQAGGMLAEKWHLPPDVMAAVKYHDVESFRGDFWPLVVLVGYCSRQTNSLFLETGHDDSQETISLLGIDDHVAYNSINVIADQINEIKEMGAILAGDA